MTNPGQLPVPVGAWDCHVHVVGAQETYPMVQERQYTAAPATVDHLRDHLIRHRLSHAVIIQPSFYGTDNRCLTDALRRMQGAARGVAVLAEDITLQEMRDLHAIGIRGIRINMESAAVRDPEAISNAIALWADKIAPLNWHIQTYAAPAMIARVAKRIDRLPVPFVLDHYAMIAAGAPAQDPCLQAVLDLLRSGNTYVKLSAPYRITDASCYEQDAQNAVATLARLLYDANPERVLWGTDWPHTNRGNGVHRLQVSRYRTIPPAMLTDAVRQWSDEPDVLESIFVRNPLRLYR